MSLTSTLLTTTGTVSVIPQLCLCNSAVPASMCWAQRSALCHKASLSWPTQTAAACHAVPVLFACSCCCLKCRVVELLLGTGAGSAWQKAVLSSTRHGFCLKRKNWGARVHCIVLTIPNTLPCSVCWLALRVLLCLQVVTAAASHVCAILRCPTAAPYSYARTLHTGTPQQHLMCSPQA